MSENSISNKFLKEYGNFQVELSGSLLSVKENGETIHAKTVGSLSAMNKFKATCDRVKSYVAAKQS
jgi:hypothetical protein